MDVRGKRVLMCGAGPVALRKTKGLLEAGAEVIVLAPDGDPEFLDLPVKWVKRKFRVSDVKGFTLIFAATSDRHVNQAISTAAAKEGIPVNVADKPGDCAFLVPARVRRGSLQVAISTSGENPKLAVEIRQRIEQMLDEYSRLIEVTPVTESDRVFYLGTGTDSEGTD